MVGRFDGSGCTMTPVNCGYLSVAKQYPPPSRPELHRTSAESVPGVVEKFDDFVRGPQTAFVVCRFLGSVPLGVTLPEKQF
jgi:hypothetical protein